MVEVLEKRRGDARIALMPALGGGIARLDVAGKPVLRPFQGDHEDPFSLASNVLVPFSNRIAGGGFSFEGRRYDVPPNRPGFSMPIHGDGHQRVWSGSERDGVLVLDLPDGNIGPWRYSARQVFDLEENGLRVTLRMTNKADGPLPYGGGFHPWFPRSAQTLLNFGAKTVWMRDEDVLPTVELDLSEAPDWRFDAERALPDDLIDNCFTEWDGRAEIRQGEDAVSCTVTAPPPMRTAIVYSPDKNADFFCFEPVSHPVNAHGVDGLPGLTVLAPGASVDLTMSIGW